MRIRLLLFILATAAMAATACTTSSTVATETLELEPDDSTVTDETNAHDASTDTSTDTSDDSADTSDDSTDTSADTSDDSTDTSDDTSDDSADTSDDTSDDSADTSGDTAGAGEPEATTVAPRQAEENDGFGLGGPEQLAGLVGDCEAGNDLACDVLFSVSGFDSDEEAVALSCGGRTDPAAGFCTADIVADDDSPFFDPDASDIDDLVTACVDDANMTACDFLFYRSPPESEFEEIGNTCGGRIPVARPDCRSEFADSEG